MKKAKYPEAYTLSEIKQADLSTWSHGALVYAHGIVNREYQYTSINDFPEEKEELRLLAHKLFDEMLKKS